jgi:hypothetical protein
VRRIRVGAYRETDGHIIPALLPAIAARMILEKEISFKGIADLRTWISFDQFLAELNSRGVSAAFHNGNWKPVSG